jgi:hypothetical protein
MKILYSKTRKSRVYQWIFMIFNRVMLWIYLCEVKGIFYQGVLYIVFENENFDKVSSNWNQLILFNKIIIMLFLSFLLVDLNPI